MRQSVYITGTLLPLLTTRGLVLVSWCKLTGNMCWNERNYLVVFLETNTIHMRNRAAGRPVIVPRIMECINAIFFLNLLKFFLSLIKMCLLVLSLSLLNENWKIKKWVFFVTGQAYRNCRKTKSMQINAMLAYSHLPFNRQIYPCIKLMHE